MSVVTKAILEQTDPRLNFGRLDDEVLLNQNEVARVLGLSGWTIQMWRQRGRGPAYIKLGSKRTPRYTVGAIKDWIAQQQQIGG